MSKYFVRIQLLTGVLIEHFDDLDEAMSAGVNRFNHNRPHPDSFVEVIERRVITKGAVQEEIEHCIIRWDKDNPPTASRNKTQ